jgi:hypothetical protein
MNPEEIKAEDEAIEALIGASLSVPDKDQDVTDEEIRRYVEQRVTLNSEDKAALDKSKAGLLKTIEGIVLGKPRPDQEHVTAKHSRGIFYRRAAFDAYVINALSQDPNLGRTKIEKITHLAEYHCGIDFERTPVRDAAGPVDYTSRLKAESLGRKQGWFFVVSSDERPGKKYLPGPNFNKALAIAERTLGCRKNAADSLIRLISPLDTRACEVVATLYAAWNDLLLTGVSPDDAQITSEAREHWHPEKLRIPLATWATALHWMREKQLTPTGRGKPVRRID